MLVAVDRLDARRAIHMAHRRDALSALWADVIDEEHERRLARVDKPRIGLLLQDDRRDWAKILAILDLIETRLHLGMEWRGQNRTGAERARAELHPSLEPA